MFNNTYFLQYLFNIIPFAYNYNIVGCFIKRNSHKPFWSASKQLMMSIWFRIGIDLDGLVLVLRFVSEIVFGFNKKSQKIT